ncbi:hypothetical protein BDZ89DRAFT_1159722 [Hymenopellis radicata]|nr:hypothetical protein BDZ89DRAFT_1159722 [Hymenopellis radicata]
MLPSIRQLYRDEEEEEEEEPPKKKRRRQALSCTECKRRKIRCDRNQPCAPCTRRGEQSKCVWSPAEPAEKYVTRQEYDELRERVTQLEALVQRLSGGTAASAPSTSTAGPSTLPYSPYPPSSYSSSAYPSASTSYAYHQRTPSGGYPSSASYATGPSPYSSKPPEAGTSGSSTHPHSPIRQPPPPPQYSSQPPPPRSGPAAEYSQSRHPPALQSPTYSQRAVPSQHTSSERLPPPPDPQARRYSDADRR